ncbi:hypothetical protein [Actinophytocola sp.]|uniref:hypothetical protein n=1 Tax=Actinophytocola sp. TaxID=1872138 RepID=UPI002ED943D4
MPNGATPFLRTSPGGRSPSAGTLGTWLRREGLYGAVEDLPELLHAYGSVHDHRRAEADLSLSP